MVCSLLAYAPMGLSLDDASSSGLIVSHVLYKAAFVIALMRWVLFWALKLRQNLLSSSSSSSVSGQDFNFLETEHAELQAYPSSMASSSSSSSTQLIRDCLIQTTYEEITKRLGQYGNSASSACETCAVCLSQLEMGDEVRVMRNCCHVFHTECIDRWLDYNGHEDNHKTCPLCRTPLLTSSQIQSLSSEHRSQPSWAVERLLYLFGEDLL